MFCCSCLSFSFPVSLISSAVSHWSHRLHVRVNVSFNIFRDTRKVSETWICTPSVMWVVQGWVSTWGYGSCTLPLQTRKWRKLVIILCYFILFFLFMYLHFIVSYYVMVQVCSAAVESGWHLLFRFTRTGLMNHGIYAFQTKNQSDVRWRTLNLHCGIEVVKQRGASYWCHVTTRTTAW